MNTSTLALLKKHFDLAIIAPDGIKRLRELILTLAMQGKLVPQDATDHPACELLKEIESEKKRLVKEGKIKEPKPLPEIKAEDVPYAVPKGWEWVRLGEIAEYIQRGKGPIYSDEAIFPVVSQKCVQWSGFDTSKVKYIDPLTISLYTEERFLKQGDLLWNSTGTGTIGRVCLYQNEFSEYKKVVADSHVTIVRVLDINPIFVYRYLMGPFIQNQIEDMASGTTNQIELNTSTIVSLIFPLPPLAEQKRIVAKIDQLMATCDALEQQRNSRQQMRQDIHSAAITRLLDATQSTTDSQSAWAFLQKHFSELHSVKENVTELRKAILQLAVMGKLVRQDPKDQPASELLKEIEDEKKRLVKEGKIKAPKLLPEIKPKDVPYPVPKGWEWVRLGAISNGITSGSTPSANEFNEKEGVPFLKVYNIRNQKIDFEYKQQYVSESYCLTKLKRSCLYPGDVIMNIVGPPLGKVAIIPSDFKMYNCNQAIVFFRSYISECNNFIYLFLLAGEFLNRIELIGTAGQDNISVSKSNLIEFPLPPLAEQKRIVAKIDDLMTLCDKLEQGIDEATKKQSAVLEAVVAAV